MSTSDPALILLHGGVGPGPAEKAVGAVRAREGREAIRRALAAGFGGVIVATDSPAEFDLGVPGLVVDPDQEDEPFRLGPRVAALIAAHGLRRPVLLGAGSLPLLGIPEFRTIARELEGPGPRCVTNNFYSGDVTGWSPASLWDRIAHPPRDNLLPRLFRDEAGAEVKILPRTTATQFDLDTPTDVAILALKRDEPCAFPALVERARSLLPFLCDREAEIVVAGRVGSSAWRYLESETACRVRVFSEERGLATAPPGYQARSALGYLLEDRRAAGLFTALRSLGEAVFLDSRVIFRHFGLALSRELRFRSDLLDAVAIPHLWLREFTAAAEAAGGVLLGGHSLVSGGLMALNDAAWSASEGAAWGPARGIREDPPASGPPACGA